MRARQKTTSGLLPEPVRKMCSKKSRLKKKVLKSSFIPKKNAKIRLPKGVELMEGDNVCHKSIPTHQSKSVKRRFNPRANITKSGKKQRKLMKRSKLLEESNAKAPVKAANKKKSKSRDVEMTEAEASQEATPGGDLMADEQMDEET